MKRAISIAAILSFLGLNSFVYGYWVWTPETKEWVNPKYAAKDSPEEQLIWAESFFKKEDYSRAIKECKRLIRAFPNSEQAPEAQYLIGRAYEEQKGYYEAFLAYQKVIDNYTYTKKTDDIIEREYRIGNLFYSGEKTKLLGMAILPAQEKAIEVFRKVVENSPYGEYADLAQFKIGECYQRLERHDEAIVAFKKIVEEYPDSKLVDDAQYQIAHSSYKSSLKPSYDQELTEDAIEEFGKFVKKHRESELKDVADDTLLRLKENKAKSLYEVAHFYERQKKYESAIIYYKEIVEDYPRTQTAKYALDRLTELEARQEGQKKR